MTWKEATDYLRCSPQFHGQIRNDTVIVQKENGVFFARLIFIFTCTINGQTYPLALVQPYKVSTRIRMIDRDLGLYRVQQRLNNLWKFIPARSIVKGAYLVDDDTRRGEAFVLDIIDSVMYLRYQTIFV